jgi:serine/threonine-protein kinase
MSVIWRANDESLERIVAVKVLAADLAADARFRELVRAEARAAAALHHRHITAVYDYGETFNSDGALTAYVVMELLDGEPLSARLTEGPLRWPEAVRIGAEVAEALAAAHRLGIVHRDITADNVMLTSGGAKLLDFGIATTVGAPDEDSDGMTFGTPAYVAPERLDGHRARPATDTYALGVLLFEMLTGRPPYPAETWEELAATQREQPPPLAVPGLPSAVAVLCRRGLATDPQQRPTANQLAETLRRQLPGADRRRSAYRLVAVAGTAAALALGTLAGATLLNPGPPPKAYPPAAGTALPGEPAPGATDRQPGSPAPDDARSGPAPVPPAGGVDLPGVDRLPPDGELSFGSLTYLIADGHARNDIREDVALDLRQLVDNLQRELAAGSTDLPSATALVRDKVRTRAAEGSLAAGLAAELDAALDQLVG